MSQISNSDNEEMPETLQQIFNKKEENKPKINQSIFTKNIAEKIDSSNLESDKLAKANAVFDKMNIFNNTALTAK